MFEPLNDVVRLRRLQLGLSQEQVARRAKVSRRQLSLLEDGRNVSLLFLMKIVKVLEITELPIAGTTSPYPAESAATASRA
jgi:transcriptional regulator with XRE-family HTH domain